MDSSSDVTPFADPRLAALRDHPRYLAAEERAHHEVIDGYGYWISDEEIGTTGDGMLQTNDAPDGFSVSDALDEMFMLLFMAEKAALEQAQMKADAEQAEG